jgi:hypothetical protein
VGCRQNHFWFWMTPCARCWKSLSQRQSKVRKTIPDREGRYDGDGNIAGPQNRLGPKKGGNLSRREIFKRHDQMARIGNPRVVRVDAKSGGIKR